MHRPLFFALVLAVLVAIFGGWLNAGTALLSGIFIALTLGHPWVAHARRYSALVLKAAIVLMGFGMSISSVAQTASATFWITAATLVAALVFGYCLMRLLQLDSTTSLLLSSGTAICGGSAIAAVSQVIKPPAEKTAFAVTVVFLLNIVALYIFPVIGQWLALTQYQFGVWAALAIHDTSSVVGAAAQFGDQALDVASTAKLARALWIIPLTVALSMFWQTSKLRISIPLFIILFLLAAIARSLIQAPELFDGLALLSRYLLNIALFMMGLGMTRSTLRDLSLKPLLFGILLWLLLAALSLVLVLYAL
ncbi:MAG: putative sulfate exporter family transporter [Gammaproteobacteria bacterium]|nr:putative sulfate exporter family transporter [Gammaproteobacteria bacterium]NVK87459.1 putative sulfate exporter family transporter [Gammaproteobacteria bacterium]